METGKSGKPCHKRATSFEASPSSSSNFPGLISVRSEVDLRAAFGRAQSPSAQIFPGPLKPEESSGDLGSALGRRLLQLPPVSLLVGYGCAG
jgi:hypothetical protein